MAVLVVERGPLRGQVVRIPEDRPVVIGREAVCGLRLEDPAVSRRHCAVGWERGRLWVRDLGSSNGTGRNAHTIAPGRAEPLEIGDRLRIGTSLLTVLDDTTDPRHDALTGDTVAGHRVLERLGANELGTIYRALQLSLEREVALMVLAPALAAQPAVRERFLAQARAAGQLVHPHLVRVYDVGEHGPLAYFTMELVDGGTLRERIEQRGALDPDEVRTLARAALEALAYAESRGAAHGQLGPEAIRFGVDDTVKIAGQGFVPPPGLATLRPYTAPERLGGEPPTARSDLYALGATLYHALTGRPPYPPGGTAALREAIESGAPPPIDTLRPGLDRSLVHLIERLTARDPAERPAGAQQALALLDAPPASKGGGAPVRRRRWLATLGVAALVLLVAAGLWWQRRSRSHPTPPADPGGVPARAPLSPDPAAAAARERERRAGEAIAKLEELLRRHPDRIEQAASGFEALARAYDDLPAVAERARAQARRLRQLEAQLERDRAERARHEQQRRAARERWLRALARTEPAQLSERAAELEQLLARYPELDPAPLRTALAERREALAQRLERELAQALARGDAADARARLAAGSGWLEAGRAAALGARIERWEREREAAQRARERADLERLAQAASPEALARLDFEALIDRLEGLGPRLATEAGRQRLAARLRTLRAEQAALAALRRHVETGAQPPLRAELAPGLEGRAVALEREGLRFRADGEGRIEVVERWAELSPQRIARLFGAVRLDALGSYGLGHILLDRGADALAREAFERAQQLAAEAGDDALRARAAAALAGRVEGRP